MAKSGFPAALLVACVACVLACEQSATSTDSDSSWQLTFADEFDGPEGQLPESSRWQFDLGTGPNQDGWGNHEHQLYTDRPANASLDGAGHLRLVARRERLDGQEFTSARLHTRGRFAQAFGRFEVRARLPVGQGIWPAFWMLGADFPEVRWPQTGEIDVLEYRGQENDRVIGSLHGPGYSAGDALSAVYVSDGETFDQGFHTFAVEWTPDGIAWLVDDEIYHRRTRGEVEGVGASESGEPEWVFDKPFFLLLNLAVGGSFVGAPDESTPFPATLLVDYVRVYRSSEDPS